MPKKKFVIYGVPRVGSNFLISVLNNHPDILCHYEIFHKEQIYTGFWDKKLKPYDFGTLKERDQDPHDFLERVFAADSGFEAVGYNLFQRQNRKALAISLSDRTQKKVLLKRRDVLRNYVSLKIAMKTNAWTHGAVTQKKINDKRIIFDKEEFLFRVDSVNKFYSFIETGLSLSRQESLVIYYEDFIQDTRYYMTRLFEFIGVNPIEVKTGTRITKQNFEELEDLVINYNEIVVFCNDYLKN